MENFINLERRTSVQLCKMIVENRVGVLGDKEMEEAARRDFQEEPGMMERWQHHPVHRLKDLILFN